MTITFLGETEIIYANSEEELKEKKLEVINRLKEEYYKVNKIFDEAVDQIKGNCRSLKK